MIAKFRHSTSVSVSVRYNEKKIEAGEARLIYAGNFLKDAAELSSREKLQRFNYLNELNHRARINTVHVSINFHPSDQPDDEKLTKVAFDYMRAIGYGSQPYLVYRHIDTGHPHMHIVASCINPDGGARFIHAKDLRLSSQASRNLEQKYQLVNAETSLPKRKNLSLDMSPSRVQYGKRETGQQVDEVLSFVLKHYKFTCFAEFNAVLHGYHLSAVQGRPGSKLYERNGMVYHVLNEKGRSISASIKASTLSAKPTKARLEGLFREKKLIWGAEVGSLKLALMLLVHKGVSDWTSFVAGLRRERIVAVPFASTDGIIQDLVLVNHSERVAVRTAVFGGNFELPALAAKIGLPGQGSEQQLLYCARDIHRAMEILERREKELRPNNGEEMRRTLELKQRPTLRL